jgi:hypothetical protein
MCACVSLSDSHALHDGSECARTVERGARRSYALKPCRRMIFIWGSIGGAMRVQLGRRDEMGDMRVLSCAGAQRSILSKGGRQRLMSHYCKQTQRGTGFKHSHSSLGC